MKLGAERKKIAILGGLVLVAAYLIFFRSNSDDTPPPDAKTEPRPEVSAVAPPRTASAPQLNISRAAPLRTVRQGTTVGEFKPSLKPRDADEAPDAATADPTLRLDLLAKLQQVGVEGGARNLFEFGTSPPPPMSKPPVQKIIPHKGLRGLPVAGGSATVTPLKPPPPPIPLKFFGYLAPTTGGKRRAFFLAGDDIFVASEGDLVQKRYKVIRIGVNSVVMEDTQYQHQQTLPMEVQPG